MMMSPEATLISQMIEERIGPLQDEIEELKKEIIKSNKNVTKEENKIMKEKETFILIRKMKITNGESWEETKIFDGNVTLSEAMNWALNFEIGEEYKLKYSRKKVIITKPHQ